MGPSGVSFAPLKGAFQSWRSWRLGGEIFEMKATLSTRRMFGSGLLILVLAGILGTAMWIWQDLRFEPWNRGEHGLEG